MHDSLKAENPCKLFLLLDAYLFPQFSKDPYFNILDDSLDKRYLDQPSRVVNPSVKLPPEDPSEAKKEKKKALRRSDSTLSAGSRLDNQIELILHLMEI